MVESASPAKRRTVKGLVRAARQLDRKETNSARKRLRSEGWSLLSVLNPNIPYPPELTSGHAWRLSSDDTNRTRVVLSHGNEAVKVEITQSDSVPKSVEVPLISRRRPGEGAIERTWDEVKPLTESTAQEAQRVLQNLKKESKP